MAAVDREAQRSQARIAGHERSGGDERVPRPSVVVVLTDGYTPWPERPPRGLRLVVGLLREGPAAPEWAPPGWARVVEIDE